MREIWVCPRHGVLDCYGGKEADIYSGDFLCRASNISSKKQQKNNKPCFEKVIVAENGYKCSCCEAIIFRKKQEIMLAVRDILRKYNLPIRSNLQKASKILDT